MPSRRLALVHQHKGPWVCTHGVQDPVLRVTGLPEGLTVVVQRDDKGELTYAHSRGNGIFPLRPAMWMRVLVTHGDPRKVICEILSSKAVA